MYAQDPYTALTYFYISFSDQEKQLCRQRPDTPKHLRYLFDRFRSMQPSLGHLIAALKEAMNDFSKVYLVIDGVDECPRAGNQRFQLLDIIKHIQTCSMPNTHILLTSRNEQVIEEALKTLFSSPATRKNDLETHRGEVDSDVGIFIDERLASYEFNGWPDETKRSVKEALREKADGMYGISVTKSQTGLTNLIRFQYVSLQLDALKQGKALKTVREALMNLPAGLDETYDRAFLSLDENQQIQAIRALQWLAFSSATYFG